MAKWSVQSSNKVLSLADSTHARTLQTVLEERTAVPPSLHLPDYPRTALAPGVLHLGLGAFHRAHQAVVFDALLQAGDPRWGVLGVAMRSTELADALARQDGLYTLQVASAEGRRWQLVGSVLGTCVAAREPERVTAAIAAPATRWVTLTVTEKAYGPGSRRNWWQAWPRAMRPAWAG
jgi:fructuronate reductase